ncbi:MAG: hypothetical protein IJ784_03495 [Ruminiclostridium sp.]|nr:hypothetical protein [Ruminiclostridium sp.]
MSDKIKLNVTMKCKADSYSVENKQCIVEEVVTISDIEFLEMASYPCRDNPHITLHKDSMYADKDAMHCVLFIAEKKGDGFLVEAEGYDYARYSQYIPHAADIVAGQHRRLTEVSEKLYSALEKNLDFLVAESRSEPHYRIPIDAVFDTPEINECLLELAGELLKEQAEFADIKLSCNDKIVTIDGDKYETLRFISPLCVDLECVEYKETPELKAVTDYAEYIRAALEEDHISSQSRGLMVLCNDKSLKEKVYSIQPDAEVINGELVAVTTVKLIDTLTEEDAEKLKKFLSWEYLHNWGEEFQKTPIDTGGEMITADFGNNGKLQFMTEEEWEQSQDEGLVMQQ